MDPRRHVREAHNGLRPHICALCGKSYGRQDYLLRHLKSHNESGVAGLATAAPSHPSLNSSKLLVTSGNDVVSDSGVKYCFVSFLCLFPGTGVMITIFGEKIGVFLKN
jgi:hypothetical protein